MSGCTPQAGFIAATIEPPCTSAVCRHCARTVRFVRHIRQCRAPCACHATHASPQSRLLSALRGHVGQPLRALEVTAMFVPFHGRQATSCTPVQRSTSPG
eukprot:gene17787-36416_t